MTLQVIRRRGARLDIEEAAFWYAVEADLAIAERFVAAVETVMRHIARHPASGSPRYADLGVHVGLRFWPTHGFPWLVFYREHDDRVEVWRVLHAQPRYPALADRRGLI